MAKPLTLNLVNAASYDPMSPSYDPNAASPCNPFPTKSPFLPVYFKRPRASGQSSLLSMQPMSLTGPEQSLSSLPYAQVPPPHSAPSLRRTKPCRFYLDIKGCKSGRWCNFKHPVGARPPAGMTDMPPAPAQGWDSVPDVRELDPDWGKETDGDIHPKYRTQPCKNYLLGLCRFGERCQFIHPPDIVSPVPVYPAYVPLDYFKLAALASYANVLSPEGLFDTGSQSILNRPNVPGQTVPCSNFEMDGECSHGSQCRFIHKPKVATRRFKVQVKKDNGVAVQQPDKDKKAQDSDVGSEKSRVGPAKVQMSGAIKSVSGVQKPTWRVVGGGVPLAIAVPKRSNLSHEDKRYELSEVSSSLGSPTGSQSPLTRTSSPSPSTISLPSPEDFVSIDSIGSSLSDLGQYDFATPTHFVNQEDFLRPPSPDVPLDITMGSPELYDLSTTVHTHHGPRKRLTLTGNDLIRQMREGNGPQRSPVPRRSRSKPQLTINVPSLRKSRSSIDIVRGNPGQTPFPHVTKHPVRPREMDPVVELSDHTNDTVDDDWPKNIEDHDEEGPKASAYSYTFSVVDEIQRPHSTPPTPPSGTSIQVPLLPRLPAESP